MVLYGLGVMGYLLRGRAMVYVGGRVLRDRTVPGS